MLRSVRGDLFYSGAEALVNTVNCVGVMGKGLALQFKRRFPGNFKAYYRACMRGAVRPGKVMVYSTGRPGNPKYVINFPTKRHWRQPSRIEDIEAGLESLVDAVKDLGIKSIAVPPLGCGLGGLDWDEVRPLIVEAFSEVPDVEVLLYEPR